MDSQRRHELEHNTLFQALQRVPGLIVDYGSYVLLGLAVLVALYFFFRTRSTAEQQEREAEAVGLYSMAETVEAAQQFRRLAGFMSPEEVAARHADVASDFEAYSLLPATSKRPGVRSRALRLRGDLAWTLATYPKSHPSRIEPSTQPTTQPATQPSTVPAAATQPSQSEIWLGEAEAAYREVAEKYPEQTADNLAALFGLAAIAEQRGRFQDAGKHYDALIARSDASEGVKNLAKQRKRLLGILAMNPRLAKSLPPATLPATQPATQANTQPSTAPASEPATAPATQPG